jgi:6-pyruvoyltetrahydropterin/6-carboxytetrahydropterin synthase
MAFGRPAFPGTPRPAAVTEPLPVLQITRREEFSAAHRLHNPALSAEENRRLYGICNNPNGHGHNYALEVTVHGEVPPGTGMVMDLNRLMLLLREEILQQVDHRHLNHDVPFLAGVIPTAENVAIAFWNRLAPRIEEFDGCRLHRIRLFESRQNYVEYHGPKARAASTT